MHQTNKDQHHIKLVASMSGAPFLTPKQRYVASYLTFHYLESKKKTQKMHGIKGEDKFIILRNFVDVFISSLAE